MINQPSKYKWYILTLGTLTHILVFSMPRMCIPVLFKEIADDLGLNLVQVGTVWGMLGLAGLFTGFAFGGITDRFGAKRTLGFVCILQGLTGALRGASGGFYDLAVFMLLFGIFCVPLSFATHKAAGQWFSGKQLALANGILALGIGVGTTVASMISATVLSPLVGGWRNLMFIFGVTSVIVGLLWLQTRRNPGQTGTVNVTATVPFKQALSHVVRLKAVWLLVIAQLFTVGSRLGQAGYLPLHLRSVGWPAVSADGAVALMGAASVVGVIPLSILSDRIGRRKAIMLPSMLLVAVGIGLLAVFDNWVVWLSVLMVGIVREALAAVYITMMMETEGVGPVYAGTALGLSTTLTGIGTFLSPPIGNRLAEIDPSFAFIFWAAEQVVAFVIFLFVMETGWRRRRKTQTA